MKTLHFTILAFVLLLSIYILTNNSVDALCVQNPDWPSAPCYGCAGCTPTHEQQRDDWNSYYEYKGVTFMKTMQNQMIGAIENGTLHDWVNHNQTNYDVWRYYYLNGQAPFFVPPKGQDDNHYIFPPLMQLKSGIDSFHIKCNDGMIPVVQYNSELPMCVQSEHIEKLQARGMNLLLRVPDSQPAGLVIEGFSDSYKIGQKIDFKIKFNGTALGCDDPKILVTDPTGNIVWTSNTVAVSCAPGDREDYKQLQRQASDYGDLRINDNSGWHRLVVFFNDKTLTKDFWINSQETRIAIPGGFSENKTGFEPENITVKIGLNETVVWQNGDSVQHKIIADNYDDPEFYDSTHFDPRNNSTVGTGQHFVHYFIPAIYGTFGYHSESGQHGTVTVLPPDNQLVELQIQHPEQSAFEHRYSNDEISIVQGARISWENLDNVTHTISSKDGIFDSGPVLPRTRFTLDTSTLSPGYYDYFDKLNPSLNGEIRLVEPIMDKSYDQMLIEKAKKANESQLFLKKYPDAVFHVENNYYDTVQLSLEKQVYPASMADGGTRELRLEITFDRNHDLKNVSIVCEGPISLVGSDVMNYLKSETCLNPKS